MTSFFQKIQTQNTIWTLIVFFYAGLLGSFVFFAYSNAATVYTVCDSGCDYTTINDASMAALTSDDVIRVVDGYSGTGEATNIDIAGNVTLECIGTPTIGNGVATTTIGLFGGATFQGCTMERVYIDTNGEDIIIADNDFSPGFSEIYIDEEQTTVTGNTNIPVISGYAPGMVISQNTFLGSRVLLITNFGQLTVTENTFNISNLTLGQNGVFLGAYDILFATNTVMLEDVQTVDAGALVQLNGTNVSARGNFISAATGSYGLRVYGTTIDVSHNTVRHDRFITEMGVNAAFAISINDGGTANINYNLAFNTQSDPKQAFSLFVWSGSATMNADYNATWGEAYNAHPSNVLNCSGSLTGCTVGANWQVNINPHLRIWNVSTADDLYPAPYSSLLDVNGDADIGAYSGVRRPFVYINNTGSPIDYTAVDTTSTDPIFANNSRLRSGDTIQFASGEYFLPSFTTTTVASDLAIAGAGVNATVLYTASGGTTVSGLDDLSISGVTFRAAASSDGLIFDTTSNSTISNVVFDSASSTISNSYLGTRMIFDFDGSTYDDSADLGEPPNSTFVFYDMACRANVISNDIGDITDDIDSAPSLHLALAQVGGLKVTALIPSSVAVSEANFEAQCSGFGVTVDAWVEDAFVLSGDEYTYNSAAVASANITLTSGYETPQIITVNGHVGIKLISSLNNTFTNVTSTDNGYGFFFYQSYGNTIVDSVVASSTKQDILSLNSSGTNELKNTSFNHTSTTVVLGGTLSIYQKVAVTVRNTLNELIGGAVATYNSANNSVTGFATTTAGGTSPYTTDLLASVYTNTTTVVTAGGYNPYTFSISATSTYGATSTVVNLSEPYQAITIYLASAEPDPEPEPEPPTTGGSSFTQPPPPASVITNFKINNGALTTTSTAVLINLDATNASQMVISEDPSFTNIVATSYQNVFTTTLSTTPGIKTVYARTYNSSGAPSDMASATIEYSVTPPPIAPTGSVSLIGSLVEGMTSSTQVVLLIAHDGSATEMMVSNNNAFIGASWRSVSGSVPWALSSGDGLKHVYVKFKNSGNLESPTYTASVILDGTGPAKPTFLGSIENGSFPQTLAMISGISEPNVGVDVVIKRGSTSIVTERVVASPLGVWSIAIPAPRAIGSYSVSATAIDTIGNRGAVATAVFQIVAEDVPKEPDPKPEPPQVEEPKTPDTKPADPSPAPEQGSEGPGSPDTSVTNPSVGGGSSSETTTSTQNIETVNTTEPVTSPEEVTNDVPIDVPQQIEKQVEVAAEFVSEAAKVVTQSVSKVSAKTTQVVKTVQAIPEVQIANQAVVVPTAAVVSAVAVSGAVNSAQALSFLQLLFTQPAFLLARRRRKGWGVVYNALTKMPADLATVRLIDGETGRVVQSRVTDTMGRYQFFVKPGSYSIEVSKPNYQFPPEYLKGKTDDGKFLDVYTGGVINPVAATALSYNMPLDPVGTDKPLEILLKQERKKIVAALVGSVGLAVTAVSFVISPTPLVGGFLVLHVISHVVFRRIAIPKKPETWGVVSGPDGKPLTQAVVRVFDKQYNKLLDTQITDDKGRYAFLVGKNDYYLMIEKPGFQKVVTESISIPESENGSVLAVNVQLR